MSMRLKKPLRFLPTQSIRDVAQLCQRALAFGPVSGKPWNSPGRVVPDPYTGQPRALPNSRLNGKGRVVLWRNGAKAFKRHRKARHDPPCHWQEKFDNRSRRGATERTLIPFDVSAWVTTRNGELDPVLRPMKDTDSVVHLDVLHQLPKGRWPPSRVSKCLRGAGGLFHAPLTGPLYGGLSAECEARTRT
jgi:hypothetical protein